MTNAPNADVPGRLVLGLAEEDQSGFSAELTRAAEASAAELGWDHRRVDRAVDEEGVDILLAIGNVRLFPDLIRRPRAAKRVLWHGETLPRPTPESGGAIHRLLPTGRILDVTFAAAPVARRVRALSRLREQAAIVREPLDNLRLLRDSADCFDRIVIDSHDRAAGALAAGIVVEVIPYGYHESYAGPLRAGGERPIEVMLLAHIVGRHGRRQRLAGALEAQLARRGIRLSRRLSATYGLERAQVLGQTKVVVDIHRLPGNYPGFRFIVATAAGAALVSEPLASPGALIPGVHYLEARPEEMADAVAGLLAEEPARRRLVDAAQRLLEHDLHMRTLLPRVISGLDPRT